MAGTSRTLPAEGMASSEDTTPTESMTTFSAAGYPIIVSSIKPTSRRPPGMPWACVARPPTQTIPTIQNQLYREYQISHLRPHDRDLYGLCYSPSNPRRVLASLRNMRLAWSIGDEYDVRAFGRLFLRILTLPRELQLEILQQLDPNLLEHVKMTFPRQRTLMNTNREAAQLGWSLRYQHLLEVWPVPFGEGSPAPQGWCGFGLHGPPFEQNWLFCKLEKAEEDARLVTKYIASQLWCTHGRQPPRFVYDGVLALMKIASASAENCIAFPQTAQLQVAMRLPAHYRMAVKDLLIDICRIIMRKVGVRKPPLVMTPYPSVPTERIHDDFFNTQLLALTFLPSALELLDHVLKQGRERPLGCDNFTTLPIWNPYLRPLIADTWILSFHGTRTNGLVHMYRRADHTFARMTHEEWTSHMLFEALVRGDEFDEQNYRLRNYFAHWLFMLRTPFWHWAHWEDHGTLGLERLFGEEDIGIDDSGGSGCVNNGLVVSEQMKHTIEYAKGLDAQRAELVARKAQETAKARAVRLRRAIA